MVRRKVDRIVTLSLFVFSCHSSIGRETAAGMQPTRPADSTVQRDVPDSTLSAVVLYNALYDFGTTRREVRARFGTPVTARSDTVSNRHVEAIDSIFVWTYEDLEFHFYWATPVERELLLRTRAAVTHRRIVRWTDRLRTPAAARNELGGPVWQAATADTTLLHFSVSENDLGAEDSLVLYFVAGALVVVAITPYVD